MFQIIGAMAEFERSLIQERVRAGIRNARAKGKKIGRPGTKVNPAAVLVLRSGGASVRAIAVQLNSSVGTVSRILAASAQMAQATLPEVLHA
jgi:DNA invertase Pin-like site-specific DNA recombinase